MHGIPLSQHNDRSSDHVQIQCLYIVFRTKESKTHAHMKWDTRYKIKYPSGASECLNK